MARSFGQRRIEHSVAALTLANGRTTIAALEAAVPDWRQGSFGRGEGPKNVRALLSFCGSGAENSEHDYRVWAGIFGREAEGPPVDAALTLVGKGVATLGATTGASGLIVAAAERIADTLTWERASDATTPPGLGSHLEDALNAANSRVHSPAGDGTAYLLLSDLGPADFVIVEGVGLTAIAAFFE